MPRARSVIILAVIVAVLSIAAALFRLTRPPDHEGRGSDSYGTRAWGYRGLYELMETMHVPVVRELAPADPAALGADTWVILEPDPHHVDREEGHLARVMAWLDRGGRVVVAAPRLHDEPDSWPPEPGRERPTRELMERLGLGGVTLEADVEAEDVSEEEDGWSFPEMRWDGNSFVIGREPPELVEVRVAAGGGWGGIDRHLARLELPASGRQWLTIDDTPGTHALLAGRIDTIEDDGTTRTLAARFTLGRGEVVLLADPELIQNHALARGDNAVLAAHLVAGGGGVVVFDEFYHGLTVRGNPIWLLLKFPFGLLAGLVVALAGVLAWRGGVHIGPPLAEQGVNRRTLAEYIHAMAALFDRGRCHAAIAREVRDGVLWTWRKRLHLAAGQETPEAILERLGRRDPERARRLADAIRDLDALLATRRPAKYLLLQSIREVIACL